MFSCGALLELLLCCLTCPPPSSLSLPRLPALFPCHPPTLNSLVVALPSHARAAPPLLCALAVPSGLSRLSILFPPTTYLVCPPTAHVPASHPLWCAHLCYSVSPSVSPRRQLCVILPLYPCFAYNVSYCLFGWQLTAPCVPSNAPASTAALPAHVNHPGLALQQKEKEGQESTGMGWQRAGAAVALLALASWQARQTGRQAAQEAIAS